MVTHSGTSFPLPVRSRARVTVSVHEGQEAENASLQPQRCSPEVEIQFTGNSRVSHRSGAVNSKPCKMLAGAVVPSLWCCKLETVQNAGWRRNMPVLKIYTLRRMGGLC